MEFLSDIRRLIREVVSDALGSGSFIDQTTLADAVAREAVYQRGDHEGIGVVGSGFYELWNGDGRLVALSPFANLITQVGDQMYGERGAGLGGAPAVATGMRLGTGGETAASKTGAGAAIVTYVTGSAAALDSTPGSSLQGSSRRIQYVTTWAAGVATATGIDEWVVTNESGPTDVAGSAANTISRAVDTGNPVNKGASDTLAITWNHDLLGA